MAAVFLLVRLAKSLGSSVSDVVGIAICEDQLALEGRYGFGVVLETGLGVVCSAGTVEGQGIRITIVQVDGTTAESTTGVILALAPLTSCSGINGAGVDGIVARGLSGNNTDKQRNSDRLNKHLAELRINRMASLTLARDSIDIL